MYRVVTSNSCLADKGNKSFRDFGLRSCYFGGLTLESSLETFFLSIIQVVKLHL